MLVTSAYRLSCSSRQAGQPSRCARRPGTAASGISGLGCVALNVPGHIGRSHGGKDPFLTASALISRGRRDGTPEVNSRSPRSTGRRACRASPELGRSRVGVGDPVALTSLPVSRAGQRVWVDFPHASCSIRAPSPARLRHGRLRADLACERSRRAPLRRSACGLVPSACRALTDLDSAPRGGADLLRRS